MAVPEPAVGFGLWPRVRAATGWPRPDEDGLGLLAARLRQAGREFTAVATEALSPEPQAWEDGLGARFAALVRRTHEQAAHTGDAFAALASKVDAFAQTVIGVKNGIRETIAANDPVYGLLGLLPPAVARVAQSAFAAQVAAHVAAMIQDAAGRVAGGVGRTPGTGGPASPPGPPADDADPSQVAAWWSGLSPAERQRYLEERPELVAGLDGLPAAARDDANRLLLDRAITDLSREIDRWRAEDARLGRPPDAPPSEFALLAQHLDERRQALLRLREALGPNVPYDPYATEPRDDQRFYLLGFDNAGDGRAIVARGDPDTAVNVATLVPGILNDIASVAAPGDRPEDQNLLERIDALHRSAEAAGSPSTSVIGWLDYDSPSDSDVIGALSDDAAEDAAPALEAFLRGLRAAHVGEPSHHTLIGHSYGSLVAGLAARDGDLQVDDFVAVASPGTGTEHADELRVPHVWVTERDGDAFADLGFFGMDPSDIRYGANVFESDPPPGEELPGTKHSSPFYDVPSNVGLVNLGRIIAARDGSTYPEVLDRRPMPDPSGAYVNFDPP